MKKLFFLTTILLILLCRQTCPAKPLIGITCVFETSGKISVGSQYVDAVAANGGIPIVIPAITDFNSIGKYIEVLDGLIFIGGADVPPEAYGQKPHETVAVMAKRRYDFESRLIAAWLKSKKPALGICLGMQFTNVVSGGTLIQDIPSQVGKEVIHRGKNAGHIVNITPDSNLAAILGQTKVAVNSSHHQAIKKIGKNLKVSARSPDNVIEAAERTDGPFGLFVQWHPETMWENLDHRNAIYGSLIKACRVE